MVTAVAAAVHKVDLNGANLDFAHDSTYYVWHLRIV
jgi:hypothetical protein